jgi:hypothetical protein
MKFGGEEISSSGELEERWIIEDPDRFAAEAEAALLPFLFLILRLVLLHGKPPLRTELDQQGPATSGNNRVRYEPNKESICLLLCIEASSSAAEPEASAPSAERHGETFDGIAAYYGAAQTLGMTIH